MNESESMIDSLSRLLVWFKFAAIGVLFCSLSGCQPPSDSGGSQNSTTASTGNSGSLRRIILLNNLNSPFWDTCRAGMQEAAKDLHLAELGYQAIMEVNDGSPQGQINKLRQFGSQSDVAAVMVSPLDADNVAVADEMRKLGDKGVKIICVDADLNRETQRDARAFYIGTDNIKGGSALGIACREILGADGIHQGSYVQFVGRTGSHNARERMDGFQGAVGTHYRQADRMADDADRTRARENVRNAIQNHEDLVALVGIWSYNAPAIVDVIREKNKHDALAVVTFDAEPIAIQQMGEGDIDAMVVQNPFLMGYEGVKLLLAMIQEDEETIREMYPHQGEPDGDLRDTGLKVVVPDEDSPLSADMFGKNVDFLRYSEFKGWLDEYNLAGS